jgi:hypothetical protein
VTQPARPTGRSQQPAQDTDQQPPDPSALIGGVIEFLSGLSDEQFAAVVKAARGGDDADTSEQQQQPGAGQQSGQPQQQPDDSYPSHWTVPGGNR